MPTALIGFASLHNNYWPSVGGEVLLELLKAVSELSKKRKKRAIAVEQKNLANNLNNLIAVHGAAFEEAERETE